MKKVIKKDEKFQIVDGTLACTVPTGTYQLMVSSDGITYTPKGEPITGPDTIIVSNAPQDLFVYIDGIAEGDELMLLL